MGRPAARDPADPAAMSTPAQIVWQRRPAPIGRETINLDASLSETPLISCIMATRGTAFPAEHAITCFQRQSYPRRELVIVCAADGSEVEALVSTIADPRIRFVHAPEAASVGALRNAAIAEARGELVCVWDDDDLSHPERLKWQLAGLVVAECDACYLGRILLWQPHRSRIAVSAGRAWENTMLARRDILPTYTGQRTGSDTILTEELIARHGVVTVDQPIGYCYVAHGSNLWNDAHFDMLFGHAQSIAEGEGYTNDIALLSRAMPIKEYAETLAAIARQAE